MISAIIVTFHPNNEALLSLISTLENQVDTVIIVDNTPEESPLSFLEASSFLRIHHIGNNVGIARAQNIGINLAYELNMEDVIFFDQDSIPSTIMVKELISVRERAIAEGVAVAAVGPVHFDVDSCQPSRFVCTQGIKLKLVSPDFKSPYFIADFVIASGSLINVSVLRKVGTMDDDLFIDCVDIEWGYRAKSAGLLCVVAQSATMMHKIGDKPLILLGRKFTTHAPVRHYYFFRNVIILLKRSYMPLAWKLNVLIKSCVQAMIFTLFLPPRFSHFKYIAKGFIDGILGRTGPYER